MGKLSWTRREFIEITGVAATSAQLNRSIPVEALTLPAKDPDGDVRHSVPVNRNWRFMRQQPPAVPLRLSLSGRKSRDTTILPGQMSGCPIPGMSDRTTHFQPEDISAVSAGTASAWMFRVPGRGAVCD